VQFVRVDEAVEALRKTILAAMQPLLQKPLDIDQVGARITEIYGLGDFETIDYSVVTEGEGANARPASRCGRAANPGARTTCASA
jgi:hypothetical protein